MREADLSPPLPELTGGEEPEPLLGNQGVQALFEGADLRLEAVAEVVVRQP